MVPLACCCLEIAHHGSGLWRKEAAGTPPLSLSTTSRMSAKNSLDHIELGRGDGRPPWQIVANDQGLAAGNLHGITGKPGL
jgi:hypothetical protein